MIVKRPIYLFHFCFILGFNSYCQREAACSVASPRNKSLTEQFYNVNNHALVFKGKIKSCTLVISTGEASSIVEIEEIYFGESKLKEMKVISGSFPPSGLPPLLAKPIEKKKSNIYTTADYDGVTIDRESAPTNSNKWGSKLLLDSSYIIYAYDTLQTQIYHGFSKPFKNTPAVNNEIQLLRIFDKILKKKKSGMYVFKNQNNLIIAEGQYKGGRPVGVWKQYDNDGRIVIENNLKERSIKEFNSDGCIMGCTISYKDSKVYKHYSDKYNYQPTWQTTEIREDSLLTMTTIEFDSNGIRKKKDTQLVRLSKNSSSGLGYNGAYEEYYPTGKLKLQAQYHLMRRVGCWTWYNENGSFWAEWDYNDGKAPQ